jgi:hypothetical protein
MMTSAMDSDDLVQLAGQFGARVDVHVEALGEDSSGRFAPGFPIRLVITASPDGGAEWPLPSFDARAALELAQMLLLAAAVVDPALAARTVERQRQENAQMRVLLDGADGSSH